MPEVTSEIDELIVCGSTRQEALRPAAVLFAQHTSVVWGREYETDASKINMCFQTDSPGGAAVDVLVSDDSTKKMMADVRLNLGTFTRENISVILANVQNKTGEIKIVCADDFVEQFVDRRLKKCFADSLGGTVSDGFLDALKLTGLINSKSTEREADGRAWLLSNLDTFCDKMRTATDDLRIDRADCVAAVKTKDHSLEMTVGYLPVFTLSQWPQAAAAWCARSRRWPAQEVVDDVTSCGCALVPSDRHATYWQYDFSRAEGILWDELSPQQVRVHAVVRALFAKYLRQVEWSAGGRRPERLVDGMVTSMLLTLVEETGQGHPLWEEAALHKAVGTLLYKLRRALSSGDLFHYFLDDINLVADVPETRRVEAAELIDDVLNDLAQSIDDLDIRHVVDTAHSRIIAHTRDLLDPVAMVMGAILDRDASQWHLVLNLLTTYIATGAFPSNPLLYPVRLLTTPSVRAPLLHLIQHTPGAMGRLTGVELGEGGVSMTTRAVMSVLGRPYRALASCVSMMCGVGVVLGLLCAFLLAD